MESARIYNKQDFANTAQRLIEQIAKNNQVYEEACVNYFGVTSSQGGTILNLPQENTLKMNQLSKIVGVDNSTMTRMINQLVEKGLVERQASEKDRRLVQVGLTAAGKKLRQELAGALEQFYQDSLDKIPEKERTNIIQSLTAVNNAIGNGLEECCQKYCQR
jgi:DNA-binding MarR family transcriptional regulator